MAIWCEDEQLLASLYRFHHQAACDLQNDSDINGFCGIVARYVREHVEPLLSNGEPSNTSVGVSEETESSDPGDTPGCDSPGPWCSRSDLLELRAAVRALGPDGNPVAVKWFPDYGCALVALQARHTTAAGADISAAAAAAAAAATAAPGWGLAAMCGAGGAADAAAGMPATADTLSLHLVGLDGWRSNAHSHHAYGAGLGPGSQVQHTAAPYGHAVLPCGDVKATQFHFMLSLVRNLEKQRRTAHQKQKYGADGVGGGWTGFSRSPDFIQGVLLDALEELRSRAVVGLACGQPDTGVEVQTATGALGRGGASSTPRVSARETQPRGGFTDVGHHTGADVGRDTAWPLVREVLQFLLCHGRPPGGTSLRRPDQHPPRLLFRLAMAHLHAWLLHRQAQLLHPGILTPHVVDGCMLMLRATCDHAAGLAAANVDVSTLEAACCAFRHQLQRAAGQRALDAALAHRLPETIDPRVGLEGLVGVLPAAMFPSAGGESLEAARLRASQNLGAVPLLREGRGFAWMLEMLRGQPELSVPANDVAAQLVLRSVERELYGRVARWASEPPANAGEQGAVGSGGSGTGGGGGGTGPLSLSEVAALEQVVDRYRVVVQWFLASGAGGAVMRVELLSREVLVVWAAYCLTHEAAGATIPRVLRYGVLGQRPWLGLRHLVLNDRAAVDAALGVCAYLQRATVPGRQLFSLCDGGASTNAFALNYARGCPKLRGLWEAERKDAGARQAAHWNEVVRKQQRVRQLREQLQALRAKGTELSEESTKLYSKYLAAEWATPERSQHYSSYTAAQSKCYENGQAQERTLRELQEAGRPPPPVLQPLPQDADNALTWLFFLHMPPLLRHLSRASFLVQQCLLPLPCSGKVAQSLLVDEMCSHLTAHYNERRRCTTYLSKPSQTQDGSDGAVQLWARHFRIPAPEDVRHLHVDNYLNSAVGVWYPDTLVPYMGWRGSGCAVELGQGLPAGFFNPWAGEARHRRLVVERFTEQLPQEGPGQLQQRGAAAGAAGVGAGAARSSSGGGQGGVSELQWAMPVYGGAEETAPERGNMAIARQDLQPPWMSKPAFLAFGALRAYPLRQLHRLCAALRQRTLPLAQPAVHALVRQLLYHIGPVTEPADAGSTQRPGAAPLLVWREGWEAKGDVLPTLCAELESLADELEHAPRDQEAVQLLGEVAAYLSDWHEPCRMVARRFAGMTVRAADAMEARVLEALAAADGELVAQLRAKQVRWRAMALGCYGAGRLDGEGVGQMVQLLVLIHQGCVFQDDPGVRAQLRLVQAAAHGVMARRVQEVVAEAKRAPGLLTEAVRRVLQRTPGVLVWGQRCRPRDGSNEPGAERTLRLGGFRAKGSDGNLYSVNVLDGTVLLNGRPPSRLPREITEHPLFVRVFGPGANYEVGRSKDGVLQTLCPVLGRFYDFHLADVGSPAVRCKQQQQQQQGLKRLVVTEVERGVGGTGEQRLELLDPLEGGQQAGEVACGAWGDQLPVRLREMHSHWLSRTYGPVLLRPHRPQGPRHTVRPALPASASSSQPYGACPRVLLLPCAAQPAHRALVGTTAAAALEPADGPAGAGWAAVQQAARCTARSRRRAEQV